MADNVDLNARPEPDQVLLDIADYVCDYEIESADAYDTARHCLMTHLVVRSCLSNSRIAQSYWARSSKAR